MDAIRTLGRRALDEFLLTQRLEDARHMDVAVLRRRVRGHRMVGALVRAARAAAADGNGVAMVSLYREAIAQCRAFSEVREPDAESARLDVGPETDAWRSYLLGDPLSDADTTRALDLAEESIASLDLFASAIVDESLRRAPRDTPRRVAGLRATRIAVLAVAVLVAGVLEVRHLRAPKNVARGAAASASSIYPGTTPTVGVTNGDVESGFAVHTQVEESAWVRVDLGALKPIRRVVIYPRGDGFERELVPVVFEVAEVDGAFTAVDTHTTPFSQKEPWRITLSGKPLRFLRVRHAGRGYVALAEIEAFER
ncbi:MAG: discoidin domain-containing protein [Polyangiaceae bacterium]